MPQDSLTDGEVLAGLRDLVSKGKVRWTLHAKERMAQRKYDPSQIKECLLKGRFSELPTIPNRTGPIEYAFRMYAEVEGDPIEVAASLIPETRVVVITVLDPDKS